VREAIKLLAAMAPTPASRSRSRADRAPLHGRTRQPFNLMGHIFLNVHERTKDIS